MERRTFVGASVATLCSAAAGLAADPKPAARELSELRTYTLKPAKQPVLDDYLANALVPATKRLGVGPVGVFAEPPEKDLVRVSVLIIHPDAGSVVALPGRLGADAEFAKAAAAYLGAK